MSIVTTRAQRRELERMNARMPLELRAIPRNEWPATISVTEAAPVAVWRSRNFFVQQYSAPPPPPAKVYPAAALQLCPEPPPLQGEHADDVARALLHLYVLYAMCAGIHVDLVQWIESGK